MSDKIFSLQDVLNKRADAKLKEALEKSISGDGFDIYNVAIDCGCGKKFYGHELVTRIKAALFEKQRDNWRAQEVRDFFEEFESLKGQMHDLENQVLS